MNLQINKVLSLLQELVLEDNPVQQYKIVNKKTKIIINLLNKDYQEKMQLMVNKVHKVKKGYKDYKENKDQEEKMEYHLLMTTF